MDLHIQNNLFPPLFTIINDTNGDLNFLYGFDLLIPSSGTGNHNWDMGRKLAI